MSQERRSSRVRKAFSKLNEDFVTKIPKKVSCKKIFSKSDILKINKIYNFLKVERPFYLKPKFLNAFL